jgi:hypothetical protein
MRSSLFGGLIFLFLAGVFVQKYGNEWEIGPHGLPQTAMAEDGWHYRNGKPIDPITLSMARAGYDEIFSFVILSIFVVCGIGILRLEYLKRTAWERERKKFLKETGFDVGPDRRRK